MRYTLIDARRNFRGFQRSSTRPRLDHNGIIAQPRLAARFKIHVRDLSEERSAAPCVSGLYIRTRSYSLCESVQQRRAEQYPSDTRCVRLKTITRKTVHARETLAETFSTPISSGAIHKLRVLCAQAVRATRKERSRVSERGFGRIFAPSIIRVIA